MKTSDEENNTIYREREKINENERDRVQPTWSVMVLFISECKNHIYWF